MASAMSAAKDTKTAAATLLISAMQGGDIIDTKLFAFSRRRRGGGADCPLPIYTNSPLLMANAPQVIASKFSFFCMTAYIRMAQ